VTWDHDRVEELLAGHVLGALEPDDQALAERALLEHVPSCDRCRRTLEGYRLVAGDLALAAGPVSPPDTVWGRLRRTIGPPPRRRRVAAGWVAAGIAVAAAAGLAGWNLALVDRLDDTERRQLWLVDAVGTLSHPDREVIPLSGRGDQQGWMLYIPGEERMYVLCTSLPEPQEAYQVWFLEDGSAWRAGTLDTDHGVGMLPISTDPERWEVVMVVDAPEDSPSPASSPLVTGSLEES
jgi:hypothetical protein